MDGAGAKRPADEEFRPESNGQNSPSSNKKQKVSNGKANGYRPRPHHQNQNKAFGKPRGLQVAYSSGPQGANPLGELKNGLAYLESSQLSKEALYHAQELQKIIFGYVPPNSIFGDQAPNSQGAKPTKSAEDGVLEGKAVVKREVDGKPGTNHTDVPSPFASSISSRHPASTNLPSSEAAKYGAIPPNAGSVPSPDGQQDKPMLPPIANLALLSAPFTHPSTLPAYVPPTATNCYEPLEFLGDAYIEVIATRMIHNRFPNLTVGQWANLREFLVQNSTLNAFSKMYGFDNQIAATKAEKSNEKTWTKIVADVFEAYVAAIILSDPQHGFLRAENWLQQLWAPKIQEWLETGGKNAGKEAVNPDAKVDLQKLLVAKGAKIEYIEERPMELIKEGNVTRFYMGVFYSGFGHEKLHLGSGVGKSKVLAGLEAAKNAFSTNMDKIQAIHKQKLAFDAENKKGSKSAQKGFR